MKIAAKPQQIYNTPKKAFCELERSVTRTIQRRETVNTTQFSCKLHDIGESFVRQNQLDVLNSQGKRLAEKFVGLGNNTLAGIIYSLLIKINPKGSPIIEQLATNALVIARRFHDPIHVMARCNNLKEFYKITQPGSKKHLKILQEEKRALNEICKNYEKVQKRYCTLTREIKFEIAEMIQQSNKNEAINELNSALQILEKHNIGSLTQKINALLSKLT